MWVQRTAPACSPLPPLKAGLQRRASFSGLSHPNDRSVFRKHRFLAAQAGSQSGQAASLQNVSLMPKDPAQSTVAINKVVFVVGSGQDVDLHIGRENVGSKHAQFDLKNGRVYCTALEGEENDLYGESYTWIDRAPARTGVSYMVSPGSEVAFGDISDGWEMVFEESSVASEASMEVLLGMFPSAEKNDDKEG